MPNTHAVMVSTLMASWDVDSYRIAGVAQADMDNGVVVELGAMALGQGNGGYEYNVAVSAAGAGKLYIVDTPLPGASVEMQIMDDPRYFYNVAGRPMSLRKLVDGDHIELTAPAFAADPTADVVGTQKYAIVNGKFSANDDGKFLLVAKKNLAIGQDNVPSYVIRYDA